MWSRTGTCVLQLQKGEVIDVINIFIWLTVDCNSLLLIKLGGYVCEWVRTVVAVNSFPPAEMSLILTSCVFAGEAGLSTSLPVLPGPLGSQSRINGASWWSARANQICFALFQIKKGLGSYFPGIFWVMFFLILRNFPPSYLKFEFEF